MLSKGSAFPLLTCFSFLSQGEDGPPGNGTAGFTGAPVRFLCCFEAARPLFVLV